MSRGRKKIPTQIKKISGTDRKDRILENEMEVARVESMPEAPSFFNEFAQKEWHKVTNELADKEMLYEVDLGLLAAYCREMGIYFEMIQELQAGHVERTFDKDGRLRASKIKPEAKIARDSLDRAIKIATQFGFTPSARASIPQPNKTKVIENKYDFFD